MNDPILNDGSADIDTAADAENNDQQQVAARRDPSDRDKRLAEIAREAEKANGIFREDPDDEDNDQGGDLDGEQIDAGGQDDAGQPLSDQRETAPDPLKDLGYYQKDDGKLYTKMKINGEEREVPADQIKAYIQKDLAGDYKLQQAHERERRLQEQEQLLRQREAQIQQSLSQRPSPMDAEEARKQAKAVLDNVWSGNTEEAVDAMAQLLQRGNATVDPSQIIQAAEARALTAVEQREAQRQQEAWERSVAEGNSLLMEQHPEIYRDERLFALVNNETERMVQAQAQGDPEFTNLTPKDIITRAAQEVQGWMEGRKKPQQPRQPDGTREQRKANLKPIPKGMNATQKPKPKQEVDTSPAAVIARMRSGRAVR